MACLVDRKFQILRFLLALVCLIGPPGLMASDIQGTVAGPIGTLADAVVYIESVSGRSFIPPQEPVILNQIGLRFDPHILPVLAGTEVSFPNLDVVLHNVFSPGYTEPFNLGTYPQGAIKTKRFDKPGIVLLLCNIHHEMSAFIVVVQSPYFAVTDQDGRFTIRNVPPGRHRLVVWHEKTKPQLKGIEVSTHGVLTVNFFLER